MEKLKGNQKKYLKGAAHKLKPVAFVGQRGVTESLIRSIDDALTHHELIKVKFVEYKDKSRKTTLAETIVQRTGSEIVGMIGHVVILFRQNEDPGQRRVSIPD